MGVDDQPAPILTGKGDRQAKPETDLLSAFLDAAQPCQCGTPGDIASKPQIRVADIEFKRPIPGIQPGL